MAKYSTLSGLFKAIADAIRSMGATSGKINAQDMPDLIKQISTGSDVSGVTASAGDVRTGKKFVTSGGSLIDGTLGNATLTVNTPTVNSSGLVTASATLTKAGILESAPDNNTLQLSKQEAKTVTPSESGQTAVEAGKYTTGAVTVGAISKTYVGSGVTKQAYKEVTPASDWVLAVDADRYTTGKVWVAPIPSSYKHVYYATVSTESSARNFSQTVSNNTQRNLYCVNISNLGFTPKVIVATHSGEALRRAVYDSRKSDYATIYEAGNYWAVTGSSITKTSSSVIFPVGQVSGSYYVEIMGD